MIVREDIYAALFAKISTLLQDPITNPTGPIKTASRRLKTISAVPSEMQPAIFQVQAREGPTDVKRGLPTKWNLKPELWVFVWCSDLDSPSTPLLNPIIDAIEGVFKPDNPTVQDCTLGGKVSHCRIQSRDIEIFEGVTTGSTGYQAIAIIPIDIMVSA